MEPASGDADLVAGIVINAFKEQQAQIKQQQDEIEAQHRRLNNLQQLEALKKLLCQTNPQTEICRP